MAESFGQTYIVLDALDECISPEREAVLQFLDQIKKWNLPILHVLALSRPVREVGVAMESLRASRFDLQGKISRMNYDIQLYLEGLFRDDFYLRDWRAMHKAMITDTLIQRANGM